MHGNEECSLRHKLTLFPDENIPLYSHLILFTLETKLDRRKEIDWFNIKKDQIKANDFSILIYTTVMQIGFVLQFKKLLKNILLMALKNLFLSSKKNI